MITVLLRSISLETFKVLETKLFKRGRATIELCAASRPSYSLAESFFATSFGTLGFIQSSRKQASGRIELASLSGGHS